MDIIKCDLCKKQSPDEDGLHVANDWCKVSIESPWRRWNMFANDKKWIFCNNCLPLNEYSDPTVNATIKLLKEFFKL